jgi:hypothetical protein
MRLRIAWIKFIEALRTARCFREITLLFKEGHERTE